MGRRHPFPEDLLEQVRALRSVGVNWLQIQKRTGISIDRARRVLDPAWAERRRVSVNSSRRARKGRADPDDVENHIPAAEVARLRRLVPPDTRAPSAKLMGDPLPERSALFKRNSQSI